jgi:hypothetical protein
MQVLEELSKGSNLEEVIWSFRRIKDKRRRLRLRQNPHFYKYDKPPTSYGSRFRAEPIDNFENVEKVFILHDKSGHVYLETPGNNKRTFGNTWLPDDAIIFKGFPLVFLPFLPLTASQTSTESSRVKVSLENVSKTPSTSGIVKNFHRYTLGMGIVQRVLRSHTWFHILSIPHHIPIPP